MLLRLRRHSRGVCPIVPGVPDVATKFPYFPANISYNPQGVLNESPLDMSNDMDQSDDNVKWQALLPN
ncbi:hypothetical protein DSO57_1008115 [Entomophthora muscae]|uniref:Uncharacterized protein n=1 Tax=Entomophthora muscae TaxID=34485 RepID=A0ACC2TUZ3_9FUNG|nr:hypothetical protein DSO57_1008115 [Entomophthora muscae]